MDRKRKVEAVDEADARASTKQSRRDTIVPTSSEAAGVAPPAGAASTTGQTRKRSASALAGTAHAQSDAAAPATTADVVKKARFAEGTAPPSNAASAASSGGGGGSKEGEEEVDFVTTLANQLQKIALYGNAFFEELAFGGHAAVSSSRAATDSEYFDTLQASRGKLFALVEEMLVRAHEIEDGPMAPASLTGSAQTTAGATANTATTTNTNTNNNVANETTTAPAPSTSTSTTNTTTTSSALAEGNAELACRSKEVAESTDLLDSVMRHLYQR